MPLLCGSAALTLALAADARRASLLEHAGRWLVESLWTWPTVWTGAFALGSRSHAALHAWTRSLAALLLCRVARMPEGAIDPSADELADAPGALVLLSTGVTHYALDAPAARGRAPAARGGAVVVLIHGFSGDHTHLAPIAARLAAAGYTCLRYDCVGRGRSSCPGLPHAPELFVGQLTELLFALGLAGGGGARLHLVGCSLGGAVAASFARLHPARVASLTLIASAGLPLSSAAHVFCKLPLVPDLVFRFALGSAVLGAQHREWAAPSSAAARAMAAGYARRVARERALGRSLLSTARHFPMGELRGAFEDVARACCAARGARVLIVWGDRDATCPYANALRLRDEIFGACRPAARLVTIRGARHCVYSERAAEVAAAIVTFLDADDGTRPDGAADDAPERCDCGGRE